MSPEQPHIGLRLPPGWHRRGDTASGVVVAARPPSLPRSGVSPELVLRCVPVDGDLQTWRDVAVTDLRRQLADFALEDVDSYELGDHLVDYRRFGHRFGAVDVLTEQWAWLLGGVGVTLTATVAREDYADYGELFELVAGTVEVRPRSDVSPSSERRAAG